jgi:hypothetical protein
MKFRKNPVVIEARQFTGSKESYADILRWGIPKLGIYPEKDSFFLIIPTLEGDHRADVGDWIIQGVKGEFYPCKPDIFAQTYEPVQEGE